ncbi:MAG TPA: hypothetical protein GXX51_07665 [Firmicutes bacterium]|nr:hypothetical protein [Bacillota bacterium]
MSRHGWFFAPMAGSTVLLFIFILFIPAAVVFANPFTPLPAGHWSYSAVAEFAKAGLVDGYSKSAFTDGTAITRYEMGWIVARLSAKVNDQASGVVLTAYQRNLLKRLQAEFAGELAMIASQGGQTGSQAWSPSDLQVAQLILRDEQSGLPAKQGTGQAFWDSRSAPAIPPANPFEAIGGSSGIRLSDILKAGVQAGNEHKGSNPGKADNCAGNSGEAPLPLVIPITFENGSQAEILIGDTGPADPISRAARGETEEKDVVASVGMQYALTKLARVRAGYEIASLDDKEAKETGQSTRRATASVGVDYDVIISDAARLKAGYSYARMTDLASSGDGDKKAGLIFDLLDPSAMEKIGEGQRTTASVGLGYSLSGTTSLTLGYSLIDFTESGAVEGDHKRSNVASAELSIKF